MDTPGDYYERKREAAAAAWRALQHHKATCLICTQLNRKGYRSPCQTLKVLIDEHERAAYVGD